MQQDIKLGCSGLYTSPAAQRQQYLPVWPRPSGQAPAVRVVGGFGAAITPASAPSSTFGAGPSSTSGFGGFGAAITPASAPSSTFGAGPSGPSGFGGFGAAITPASAPSSTFGAGPSAPSGFGGFGAAITPASAPSPTFGAARSEGSTFGGSGAAASLSSPFGGASSPAVQTHPSPKPHKFDLPRIVVVGEESSGKSSVLARLCHLDFFPKDTGVCTRMPIELQLQQKTEQGMRDFCNENTLVFSESTIHVQVIADGKTSAWLSNTQIEHLRTLLQEEMNRMVTARNNGLTGIIEDSIIIKVVSMLVPTLTLVDLPGLMAATRPGEPDDLPQKTEAMMQKHITRKHTLIVAVVPAFERLNNSRVLGMIQRFKKVDMAIGVLTKIDRAVPADVRKRLRGTAEDFVALGGPYVGIRNPDTTNAQEMDVPLHEWSAVNEKTYFKSEFPELVSSTGAQVLSEQVMALLERYIRETWARDASKRLDAYESQLQNLLVRLGKCPRPTFGEMQMLDEVKGFLAEKLFQPALTEPDSAFEKVIQAVICECFQSAFIVIPGGSNRSLIQQRISFASTRSVLETKKIPQYVDEVTAAIIKVVKRLLAGDNTSSMRVSRFKKLSRAITAELKVNFSQNRAQLIRDLRNLIQPSHSQKDFEDIFLRRQIVKLLTIDALVVPFSDIIHQLRHTEGILEEDRDTIKRRGQLNAAIAKIPQLKNISQELIDSSTQS
ncbi:P-loop containing nucleoside triphosphate hydrolase protein [Powellomyces hirtus]|nr:P-loop containing nucleoside triphosphate hydrolase protein [Powellomyces hirtus]